ncbi:hypothetical protein Ancab_017489 [Ancistrocladus abbreviatus]
MQRGRGQSIFLTFLILIGEEGKSWMAKKFLDALQLMFIFFGTKQDKRGLRVTRIILSSSCPRLQTTKMLLASALQNWSVFKIIIGQNQKRRQCRVMELK